MKAKWCVCVRERGSDEGETLIYDDGFVLLEELGNVDQLEKHRDHHGVGHESIHIEPVRDVW
jgi:hypothetical protein